ncbi:hypothetical protein EG343_06835 [Chryseobacterium nakagawai]|uniref:Uncharacterized protein n=1 Tax=Chryseobacterium nakagawai TaxID=1241982 RepID=A0AAD0YI79_CHRNA|nr:hypothetical protein EG343_06835 [Chryseobacterium nakagawai]
MNKISVPLFLYSISEIRNINLYLSINKCMKVMKNNNIKYWITDKNVIQCSNLGLLKRFYKDEGIYSYFFIW